MRSRSGFVLVASLMVLVAVSIVILGTSFTSLVDRQTSGEQQRANASYYVSQAGLSQYKTLVFRNLVDVFDDTQVGWCESPLSDGLEDGNGNIILVNGASTGPIAFGQGTYDVTFQEVGGYVILTSVGRVGSGQTALQLVTSAGGGPGGAWDNAILASGSTGAAGNNNGNVSVYGSIHIVGDYEAYDPDLEVSGAVGVFNDYAGNGKAGSTIADDIAPVIGDTDVDLCARVKVKSGSLYIQANASQFGTSDSPLYGIHMRDGVVYGKKKQNAGPGDIITNHLDTTQIELKYPDGPGMLSPYDAYDIPFPQLADNYPADVVDALDLSSCTGASGELADGVLNLPPGAPFMCTLGDNSFGWHTDGYLVVEGDINIGAVDVLLGGPITYAGRGRIRQGASKADTGRSFEAGYSIRPHDGLYPSVNALALETSGEVLFNPTSSDQVIAMMVYAQQIADFAKQVILIGSVVANEFRVDKQVPNIAYHPDIRTVAEELCLVGSFCAGGVTGTNPGLLSDISIERRDTAAID